MCQRMHKEEVGERGTGTLATWPLIQESKHQRMRRSKKSQVSASLRAPDSNRIAEGLHFQLTETEVFAMHPRRGQGALQTRHEKNMTATYF